MNRCTQSIGLFCLVGVLLLTGCQDLANRPGNPPIDAIQSHLQKGVEQNQKVSQQESAVPVVLRQALMPKFTLPTVAENAGDFFDISANNVPAQAFFSNLVHGTTYSIAVSPKVTGEITLHLKHVTMDQALATLHDIYGFEYRRQGAIYQVFPPELQTQVFVVSYLNSARSGNSYIAVQSGLASQQESQTTSGSEVTTSLQSVSTPSSSIMSSTKLNFWQALDQSLTKMIGPQKGHHVIINSAAGLVSVTATPKEIRRIGEYLDHLNAIMSRQVVIQAEILKVTLNKGFQAGIEWNLLGAHQAGDVALNTSLKAFTPIFTLNGHMGDLTSIVKLLSTQGNVQVLSSPRITTLNGQKALIKVGKDEYFVTNVSNTVSGSGETAQTTQDIDMEPFFSGIALAVTPVISVNHNVLLHIHPIVSVVTDKDKIVTLNGKKDSIPSALSQVEESDNVVYARSGQVVIIGGLSQNQTDEQLGGTPFLAKIPVIGALFRRTDQASTRQEMVILLQPTVVSTASWVQQLQKAQKDFSQVKEGYHFGAFPARFGTQGELEGLKNMPVPIPVPASAKKED